ncbi:MAG: flagellar basal body rod protein FlgC [Candidatus Thiodiazotropha sp. 6PLUC2]
MDYYSAFEISASGMALEKVRLDTMSLNLANANTTRSEAGGPYRPLRVIAQARGAADFEGRISAMMGGNTPSGVDVVEVVAQEVDPRLVYDPGHPDANNEGFVAYPNINPVSEMVTMIEAVRGYEANVRALNAAKAMALSALEIGRQQ